MIVLTNFWESFYNTAKYGDQDLNIRPQDVIDANDIELALEHAQYCGETAVALFEYVKDEAVPDVPEESDTG